MLPDDTFRPLVHCAALQTSYQHGFYGRRPPLNYYSSVAAYNRRRLSGSSSEPTSLRQKRLYYARAPLGQRL